MSQMSHKRSNKAAGKRRTGNKGAKRWWRMTPRKCDHTDGGWWNADSSIAACGLPVGRQGFRNADWSTWWIAALLKANDGGYGEQRTGRDDNLRRLKLNITRVGRPSWFGIPHELCRIFFTGFPMRHDSHLKAKTGYRRI